MDMTLPTSGAGPLAAGRPEDPGGADGALPVGDPGAPVTAAGTLPSWIGSMDLPGMDESGFPD